MVVDRRRFAGAGAQLRNEHLVCLVHEDEDLNQNQNKSGVRDCKMHLKQNSAQQ